MKSAVELLEADEESITSALGQMIEARYAIKDLQIGFGYFVKEEYSIQL